MYRLFIYLTFLFSASICTEYTSYADSYQWNDVERVVVIPDIHGAYPELLQLLQSTGMVNSNSQWSGGASHLVSLGDLLDRGAQSRQVMDLLIRLQAESVEDGGRVHVVAGNHELMNLLGDLRYVSKEEFAAFAADEVNQRALNAADTQTKHPAGYHAHRAAFSANGHYGRWLLSLPAVITINDVAYAHGGLPPVVANISIRELNERYQSTVSRYLNIWEELVAQHVFSNEQSEDAGKLAKSALANAEQSNCLKNRAAACVSKDVTNQLQEFIELSESELLHDQGPLWYRGAAYCRALFEEPVLEAALENINASRVIVGHTTTPDRRVHALHDNRMTLLDTGMLTSYYKGRPAAMVIEGSEQYVQYLDTPGKSEVINGNYPIAYGLSVNELVLALQKGEVNSLGKHNAREPWPVQIAYQGKLLDAQFIPHDANHTAMREAAAFSLNQLLGFDLVPPAALRTLDEVEGVVQLNYRKALTENQRQASGKQIGGWCSLNRQLQLMYVWDVLTANSGRSADNITYQLPLWRIQLTGHDKAFGKSRRLPRQLNAGSLELHPEARTALANLTRRELEEYVGAYIDSKSIKAMLRRRDALLKLLR